MNNAVKIAIAVIGLAVAGYLIITNTRGKSGSEQDFSTLVSHWKCSDCQAEFTKTQGELRQISESMGAGPPPCPKCQKRLSSEMFECPSCKGLFSLVGHSKVPDVCPHCKKPIKGQ